MSNAFTYMTTDLSSSQQRLEAIVSQYICQKHLVRQKNELVRESIWTDLHLDLTGWQKQ